MYPMYTNGLPGRNWNLLTVTLDGKTIAEIEEDLFALVRYELASLKSKSETLFYESWLFQPGLVTLSPAESDMADRITDKLKASGSWFLKTAAVFVVTARLEFLQVTLSVLREVSGNEHKRRDASFSDLLRKAGVRPAKDAKEDAFLQDLSRIIVGKLGDHCLGDMTPYRMKGEQKTAADKRKKRGREEDGDTLRKNRRIAGICQHCGGSFKGLFRRTCSSCGKRKDY